MEVNGKQYVKAVMMNEDGLTSLFWVEAEGGVEAARAFWPCVAIVEDDFTVAESLAARREFEFWAALS